MSILERVPEDEQEDFVSLGGEGSSLFDDLIPVNQKARANKAEEFDIPGYEQEKLGGKSALVARYKRMSMEQYTIHQRAIAEAAQEERFDRVAELYADFLIDNCEEILKRVPDGPLVQLNVKYDLALARGLNFAADSCRDVVFGTFGDNELLVAEHAEQVFEWMRTGKSQEDSEALGKS
jgi:hypothetical protein